MSIASDADNQRVFSPTGSVNGAYETDHEIYGAPPSFRSSAKIYGTVEKRVLYEP